MRTCLNQKKKKLHRICLSNSNAIIKRCLVKTNLLNVFIYLMHRLMTVRLVFTCV